MSESVKWVDDVQFYAGYQIGPSPAPSLELDLLHQLVFRL